jgi:23S rRNA pseudouridine2605 synthase
MERLNKLLAHAGVGSRRHCDELIAAGRVTVDGRPVRELGTRVDPDAQRVAVDGTRVKLERLVYWLVNKPRGYLCTNDDPAGRPRAVDLVPHVSQRVYTVGRLDEDSEGLLLLTNDGDLAHRLMHPRFGVEKTYLVQVAGRPTREEVRQLLHGVWLSDGHVRARHVKRLKTQGDSAWLRIVLSEGKNREVRRMLARLGHKVMRLQRVAIGPVPLDNLPAGKARKLTGAELTALRHAAAKGHGQEADAADPAEHATEDRPEPKVRPPRARKAAIKERKGPRPSRPTPWPAKPASSRRRRPSSPP